MSKIRDVAKGFLSDWKTKSELGATEPIQPVAGEAAESSPAPAKDPPRQGRNVLAPAQRGGAPVKVTHRGSRQGQKPPEAAADKRVEHAMQWPKKKKKFLRKSGAMPPREVPAQTEYELQYQPVVQRPAAPPRKTARERLQEDSADMALLRIRGPSSEARISANQQPLDSEATGRTAIFGLDFGTAFTKAVVRWGADHFVVDWSATVDGEDPFLLPSVFSECPNGNCFLGRSQLEGSRTIEGIKIRLIESGEATNKVDRVNAIIFVALALRHADAWLKQSRPVAKGSFCWHLHLGLPALAWDDEARFELFRQVGQSAMVLSSMSGPVSRSSAEAALDRFWSAKPQTVEVFPEFACQLYAYLRAVSRQDDLHALVDIGAGTLDVAFFNVHVKEDDFVLSNLSARVENLGSHYMIGALAGHEGERLDWKDSDARMSDVAAADRIGGEKESVASRRKSYLASVAGVVNEALTGARQQYRMSRAFLGNPEDRRPIRLFLCGGGSRVSAIHGHFQKLAAGWATTFRVSMELAAILPPTNLVGGRAVDFDRVSVAYGLSQLALNIGKLNRIAEVQEEIRPVRQEIDRDDGN